MQVEIELLPTQRLCWDDMLSMDWQIVDYQGGVGSGKTFLGIMLAWVISMRYPGAKGLIGSTTGGQGRDVIAEEVLDFAGDKGIDGYLTKHPYNKSEGTINFENGSTLFLRASEKREALKGYTMDWAWLDEVTDYAPKSFHYYLDRVRGTRLPATPKLLTHNPDERGTYKTVMRRFDADPNYRVSKHRTWTGENTFNADGYLQEKITQYGGIDSVFTRRRVFGEEARAGGLVYPDFSERTHVITDEMCRRLVTSEAYFFAGIDFGYSNPFAYNLLADTGEHIIVCAEHYCRQLQMEDHANAIKAIERDWPIAQKDITRWADHDNQDRAELNKHGVRTTRAKKDVIDGIIVVNAKVALRANDTPILLINENCVNTIREFTEYEWDKNAKEDRPRKARTFEGDPDDEEESYGDHAMDEIRYALYSEKRKSTKKPKFAGAPRKDWGKGGRLK